MRRFLKKLLKCLKTLLFKLIRKNNTQKKRLTDISRPSADTVDVSLKGNIPPQPPATTSDASQFDLNASDQTDSQEEASKTTYSETNQVVQPRPYIKYLIEDLEKLADSGWNNVKILSNIHYELQFRNTQRAKSLLLRISNRLGILANDEKIVFPTTNIITTINSQDIVYIQHKEGVLSACGYKVGLSGLSERQRRQILDKVFLEPLPSINSREYMSEWGRPGTAKRLKKMTGSIAAFTRNAKGRQTGSLSIAIQHWESDLAYLKCTYYNKRFYFRWPQTGCPKS